MSVIVHIDCKFWAVAHLPQSLQPVWSINIKLSIISFSKSARLNLGHWWTMTSPNIAWIDCICINWRFSCIFKRPSVEGRKERKINMDAKWSEICLCQSICHYGDVVMGTVASQFASLTIVYSTVYSGADQRKHQSSASLAFVRGIHRGTSEFPAQMASNAEDVFIWWRHHAP